MDVQRTLVAQVPIVSALIERIATCKAHYKSLIFSPTLSVTLCLQEVGGTGTVSTNPLELTPNRNETSNPLLLRDVLSCNSVGMHTQSLSSV